MKKDVTIFLEDILKNIKLIEKFIHNMNKEQFMGSIQTQYSVIRGLEIIGEATKNLKQDVTDKYKEIPWRDIAGLRDKLIHGYFEVDLERIWVVSKDDLPDLKRKIEKIIIELLK